MKASDLKIGDWVSYEGEPIQVEDTINYLYIDGFHTGRCHTDDLKPIPLTLEILEKNDWKISDNGFYRKGRFILIPKGEETWFTAINDPYGDLIDIKYVHELQHILWALRFDDNIEL